MQGDIVAVYSSNGKTAYDYAVEREFVELAKLLKA